MGSWPLPENCLIIEYRCIFNPFPNKLMFLRVCNKQSFENTVGKGVIASKRFAICRSNAGQLISLQPDRGDCSTK